MPKNSHARKPKNGRGKTGGRNGASVENRSGEIWGLAVLAFCLITVIALLSEFFPTERGNLLGPWLGRGWASTLNGWFGRLPVLLYIAALTVVGYGMVTDKLRALWRPLAVLVLFGAVIGALLTVHLIGRSPLTLDAIQSAGGYFGRLIVIGLLGPLFGQTQFGPYLVLSLAALFLVVWGFRLSIAAWMERGAETASALGQRMVTGFRGSRDDEEDEAYGDGEHDGAVATGKNREERLPKPVKAGAEALSAMATSKAGAANGAMASKGSKTGKSAQAGQTVQVPQDPESLDDLSVDELKQLAEMDPAELDPLIVRKLRDLKLERQRVIELNEWEQKAADPEISGLLGGKAKAKPAQAEPVIRTEPGWDATPKAEKKKREEREPEPETAELAAVEAYEGVGEDDEQDGGHGIESTKVKAAKAQSPAPAPKPEVKYDPYRVPDLNAIFPDPPKQPLEFTEEELREQSKMLEAQLINFKVMGKVTQICPGPVITRYEVELAPGVKVNRIAGLADDLALALRAKSIRILAPIPGKSVVGIEVPNRRAQVVYIKEILSAPEFALEEDSLKVGLGKTIGGEPYVMDLTRAPHLLIAGQTGSGKSVCINSIMASLLLSKTPDDLRMILVDPKVVELKPYDEIPHLLHPVITQPDIAVQALKWSCVEMDRRYEVLAQTGVRNIKGFNQRVREGRLPESMADEDKIRMPYILIVIDELADLMMVAGKEVETSIARIAQKARAVGIHLLLATQRPSTNVITGTIKANLPTRIAFQVASQIDARTIMDRQGAEKLLGRGDMLYKAIDFPEPVRLHGCFLDDEQCEKVALACSDQFVNYPQVKSFNLDEDPSAAGASDEPRDEMFREAAELVVQLKQASVSLLQRRLGIGYARSGRLVDQLERAGIVGRERGSKPREVLMDDEELQSFLSSGLNDD